MARRTREEVNHWPPFVDALATIIMVLTFLVIIIALALFYISQQVNENTVRAALEEIMNENKGNPSPTEEIILAQVVNVIQEKAKQESETEQNRDEAEVDGGDSGQVVSKGKTIDQVNESPALDIEIDFQEEISGSQETTTENKVVEEPARVTFSPGEQEAEGVELNQTGEDLLLSVDFPDKELALTEEGRSRIDAVLESNQGILSSGVMEVRASARSPVGSISEARRMAYYRAVTIRNRLIHAGVSPDRIVIRLTDNEENTDFNRVNVHLRPPSE